MIEAKASMSIADWKEETTFAAPAPHKHARVFAKKRYEGDLQGESELEYLLCYTNDETSHFLGYERVTGSFDGKEGSFVVKLEGFYGNGEANERGEVVAGAGTGGLADLRGTFTYNANHTEQSHDVFLQLRWERG